MPPCAVRAPQRDYEKWSARRSPTDRLRGWEDDRFRPAFKELCDFVDNGEACAVDSGTEAEFQRLVAVWKKDRTATSFVSRMVMHPAYQRIIGLGEKVLPLILRELEERPDHWYWALKSISGEDPVPPEDRGRIAAMREAWLRWGREKGYAW